MPFILTRDGTEIFYKDWGSGPPVVFVHGWPLNSDAWDDQLNLVAENGYRAIAHDRRAHGRSTPAWLGHDNDTWADDLAELLERLDLHGVTLVAHSMGGGEVARYVGRHGTARVAKVLLLSAVPPLMLKTRENPEGTPREVFDEIRAGLRADRPGFWRDFAPGFFGADRPGSTVTQGDLDAFWFMAMHQTSKAALDCTYAFSETDFTEDLKRFDVPTLIIHGDDDQIVPLAASGAKSAELIPNATLKVYPGASHAIAATPGLKDHFHDDLLAFLKN
jgi:non-heme chloroperoxidase